MKTFLKHLEKSSNQTISILYPFILKVSYGLDLQIHGKNKKAH